MSGREKEDFNTIDKVSAEDNNKEPETFGDQDKKTNKIWGSVPVVHTRKDKCKNNAKKSIEDNEGLQPATKKSFTKEPETRDGSFRVTKFSQFGQMIDPMGRIVSQ